MSYVALETHVCPVCGVEHTHNTGILMDMRLKDLPDMGASDISLCEEHSNVVDEGYVILVEIDHPEDGNDRIGLNEANRTGNVAYVKKDLFVEHVDTEVQDFMFISQEAFQALLPAQETLH